MRVGGGYSATPVQPKPGRGVASCEEPYSVRQPGRESGHFGCRVARAYEGSKYAPFQYAERR